MRYKTANGFPSPSVFVRSIIIGVTNLGTISWDGLRRSVRFVTRLFSGLRKRARRTRTEQIVVYTVHQSFYLWLIVLVGFIASTCVNRWPSTAHAWGWLYVFTLLYTIITLLFDLNSKKAMLWGGIFLLLWIASKYLEDMKHLTMLSGVWRYLARLQPTLDPGTAGAISWLLLVPWIGSLVHSFSHGRKAFSPNSIEERFMGEGREIIDRSGLKFRTRYRDLFETILGLGAGDLEAVDGNHHVVKRWDNILFLAFRWRRLDEILHQRSAVVDNAPAEDSDLVTRATAQTAPA